MDYRSLIPQLYPWNHSALKTLLESIGIELDELFTAWQDTIEQLFVQTATWGLNRWEQDLELGTDPAAPVELRRGRILARLRLPRERGTRKITQKLAALGFPNARVYEMIKQGLRPLYDGTQYHDNGVREAAWWAHYKIKVDLEEWRSFTATDRSEIVATAEKVAPAHMVLAAIGLLLATEDEFNLGESIGSDHVRVKIQHLLFGNRRWHNGGARAGSYGPATEGDAPPRLGVASRITDRPFGGEGYAPITHGGERYRHTGSLLRRPLYLYNGNEAHNGELLRLMGWAWYGDCALLHNGAIAYGGPRTHDGTIKHGVAGDGMTFTIRRKRQPVLAA